MIVKWPSESHKTLSLSLRMIAAAQDMGREIPWKYLRVLNGVLTHQPDVNHREYERMPRKIIPYEDVHYWYTKGKLPPKRPELPSILG